MRPLVIALLGAALAALPTEAGAQLRIGARGGLNRADVRAETGLRPQETKGGVLVGAFVEGGLFGRFGWQIGPQYSQKGIREVVQVQGVPNPIEFELQVGYVEVPILVSYLLRAYGPMAMGVYVGGAPSFKVQCESTASSGSESIGAKCGEEDPETGFAVDPVKSFDATGMLGGVLAVNVGSAQVAAEVFYSFGMIPFVDEDPAVAEEEPDLEHRVTSFTIGVSFPLGGRPPSLLDLP